MTNQNDHEDKRENRVVCRLKSYGPEFCCFLYSIAWSISKITVQNFYIDRICRVSKNFSLEECHNLTSGFYNYDEKLLEVTASEYVIYQNLIETGLPIIISFFLGSWSDKNGSKPILVMSLLGYFISSLLYIIFSRLPDLPPVYILTSSVPIAFGGGLTTLIISVASLITREASLKDRSFRISIFSVSLDGGTSIGYYIGEKIYKLTGYTEVFVISAFLNGFSVICAIWMVSEKKPDASLGSSSNCLGGCAAFFDLSSVKDTISTCFKRRQNNRRRWILILTTCIALQFLSYLSINYMYLFTRNKFKWGFEEYSNFSIATSLSTNIGGLLLTLVAIKLLQIPDTYLGFITVFGNLSGFLVWIFASAGWLMYLGSGIQMLGALTTAVMRSILSKCVDPEEHGKLFSFVTCIEFAMPFVAGAVYGLIYMNTVTTFPSAFFLLPIGIQIFIALSYVYLHLSMRHTSLYSALRDEVTSAAEIS